MLAKKQAEVLRLVKQKPGINRGVRFDIYYRGADFFIGKLRYLSV